MTTLAANKPRRYVLDQAPVIRALPVVASDIIYDGACVGESSTTGTARPLTDGDTFLGFAEGKADNAAGAAGDVKVRLRVRGTVVLSSGVLGGTPAITKLGDSVYATDDDTFSLTDSGSDTRIGTLVQYDTETSESYVAYEAAAERSI